MKYKIMSTGPWQPLNRDANSETEGVKFTCPGSEFTAVWTLAATHASANVSIAAWKSIFKI